MVGKLHVAGDRPRAQMTPPQRFWRGYQAGYVAQVHGLAETDNPFPATDANNAYWAQGWTDANTGVTVPGIPEQGVPPEVNP
jgi:hypothetical protein